MKTKLVLAKAVLLLVAGSLLILVGIFVIASPADFYASNNIDIGTSLSLLNELKAPAGLLLAAGLFMIVAIFVPGQSDTGLWLAALIYLSYACSRFLSMVFDGVPSVGLVQAATLEGVVGLACLSVLIVQWTPAGRVV